MLRGNVHQLQVNRLWAAKKELHAPLDAQEAKLTAPVKDGVLMRISVI